MQSAPFSNTSWQIMNDSLSHFSSVTTATPAKRITFYKSGDTQFSGIKMPIHKRSFKCFDALLDDLSQKMPLPFGVRTITTPKGTHAIQSLEQLQDGGCYLCSDRNYVKPIDMETAGKRPAVWHHSTPINIRRKPSRPDEPPMGHTGHHYHRQPKKIVLVKNNDPAVRRSIILSRKRTRSLRVFMDEISELMQCHVRTLYTLEGRKIDSTQSLMQCPSVLVCVGREPFKASLLQNLRKDSEEKLPGIGARSHSSIYSEGHDSKKNVNFGLETKKSIIHPRLDSSNKSTRFSLSSEKSYPNGSGMTPGQLGFIKNEVVMKDDVEKRVLVNKDGSLSVEMKVRFRLVNDETLHWATEIKKLPTSTNECSSLQEGVPDCLQDKLVYSEPESTTECETEKACSSKCHQMDYCQNCCSHSQGYDIWKNPLHNNDETSGSRSTSNSPGSSNKIMHQKASVDSVYTISRSSEEYTGHIVEKASCIQQTIKEGDTRIEYCSTSRCCSQSEVSASTTKCNVPTDTWERQRVSQEGHADTDSMYSGRSSVSNMSSRAQYCCCSQCRESTTSIVEFEIKNDLRNDLRERVSKKSQTRTNSTRTVISDTSARKACKEEPKKRNTCTSAMSTCTCLSVKSTVCPCCGGCGKLVSKIPSNMDDMPVHLVEEDGEVKSLAQRSCESPKCKSSNKHAHYAPQTDSIPNILENIEPGQKKMAEVEVRHACSQSALFDLSHHLAASKQSNESNQQMISEDAGVEDEVDGGTKSAMSVRSIGSANTNSDIPDKLTTPRLDNQIDEEILNLYITQENIPVKLMQDSCTGTEERACSAMSTQTHSSKGSDKSHRSDNIQDTAATSPPTSSSPTLNTPDEKIHSERSKIALSQTAHVSVESGACSERDSEFLLNSSDMNAWQETRQTIDDTKSSSQNTLPVASPSPKSPITVKNSNQALSVKSGHSKTSSKSTRSNKHHCSSSKCVQRDANSPSEKYKSPTPASLGLLDEPLSPTSSASVSLGLVAEERSESLNERSMSNTSQIIDEPRCLSEKYILEPTVIEHALNNSAITQTRQGVKTNMSTNSTVSDKSKCQNPAIFSEVEPEGIIGTKSMKERYVEVHLLQKYGNYRVSSALSASSEELQQNPPSTTTSAKQSYIQRVEVLSDKSAENKALTISDSLMSSQNKTTSAKATAHSTTTSKDQCVIKSKQRSCSNLEIKEIRKTDTNSAASEISLKISKSDKKPLPKNKYVTKSEVAKNCTSSDSNAEHSPNLIKEKDTDEKPNSKGSKSNASDKSYVHEEVQHIEHNCKNSSRIKQRKSSTTSHSKSEDHAQEQLMPSCLPNASPTDVVHDWLKKIPNDGPMFTMEDEFNERDDEILLHIPAVEEEECFQNEIGEQSEETMRMKKSQAQADGHEGADSVTEDKNTICDAKLACKETTIATNSDCSHLSTNLNKRESLVNNCQSSIQVMKVLLGPKLDRCNSLPEVSPTYGKKLSTSAKGLLDCLANLQVIDPDPKIYDKYSEIISTLQLLWDNRPSEAVLDNNKMKVHSGEEEFNPRSSSGVDLSSGSIGSINGGLEKSEAAQGMTLTAEQKTFNQIQRDIIPGGGCDSLTAPPEKINSSLVSSDPITPDIAERVRCSPEYEKVTQKDEDLTATDDVLQTNEHVIDIKEIASTFSTRSTENNGNIKSANEEINLPVYANLRTTSSEQKGQLSKRISQDPDPVWVLSLLKKLEKQFMSHYANAIAEFKVRWDLNNNETLDIMISELKEEVHKRIQSTINRELQKIQGRAGRTPRPPIRMISRESSVYTEQRRRRLKVMQNKLIKPSESEDINTASGTEFSDQRSEDEYCPCDTCVKKKMATRVVQCAETLSVAPVLKDFDLRKILQTKKDSPVTMPVQSKLDEQKDWTEDTNSSNDQNKNHLEVLHEEKTKDENQTKDEGVINRGWRTVKGGPSDGEDDEQPKEEQMFYNNVNEADHAECKTERERHKVEEGLEDKSTEDEDMMNRSDEEAEEGDMSADEEVAMTNNRKNEEAAERKEIESSDIEKGNGNPLEGKESNDERAEEERSEGETNKESEPGKAEEEEEEGQTEEKADASEEGEKTENRTGEEQSSKECKTSRDESVESENSGATSDERAQDDVPAAAAEAKPRKNEKAEILDSKKAEEDSTSGKSEANMSTENNEDENHTQTSAEVQNEVEKVSHESKSKTYKHKPTKREEIISFAEQLASDEGDSNLDEYGTDEKHKSDMRAESFGSHAEGPDCSNQTCGDDSDCKLLTQITKTSLESQTGSLEYSKDLTVKEKLRDIQSFMESVNDQDS